MKQAKKIFSALVLITTLVIYYFQNKHQKEITEQKEVTITNNHLFNYLPTSTTGQIIAHKYYTLSYSEDYEQAEWVAYELTKKHIVYSKIKRPFFISDKKVSTKSASYKNYKNSGYDKGHLCPAGDRRFSTKAFKETFLTSNISPQKHNFNAGIWNRLEQKTRYWAKKYKHLYVITGGVLNQNLRTIGREKVAVPKQFYKILLDYTQPEIKAIAFLFPHKDSNLPLYKFVVSIHQLEEITGIDFFPNLPDAIENKLENSSNYKNWSFR